MFIIAILVLHIQQYIQAAKRAGSKTDNVDKAESLVFKQKTKGGFEITSDHGLQFNGSLVHWWLHVPVIRNTLSSVRQISAKQLSGCYSVFCDRF
jgi:hypothetical protein